MLLSKFKENLRGFATVQLYIEAQNQIYDEIPSRFADLSYLFAGCLPLHGNHTRLLRFLSKAIPSFIEARILSLIASLPRQW